MFWLWRSLYESAAMFWEVLWTLVLGFGVSAIVQVYVSKEKMIQLMGKAGLREVAFATGFGAASSSCSYAAVATANTVFKKGAALVPTLAFMFASTNLVFELCAVLWRLMGWHFVLAEFVGAFVLIGIMWLLVALTKPKGLEESARTHQEDSSSMEDHSCHMEMDGMDDNCHKPMDTKQSKVRQVADAFAMDWLMLWKEIVIGFLIAGFLAVLVPNYVWQAMFLTHGSPPVVRLIENAIVGPIIAMLSFVCSVGNIPLAGILWSGGISFGGVISFIYADLIVIPIILIYAKYYGWKPAFYITGVLFVSMVVSGIVVDLLFTALNLAPTGPRPPSAASMASFAWNFDTYMDIAAIAVAGFLAIIHFRKRSEHDAMMFSGHQH
jgi:uncharacterized membrane protein YraQ (UPF0718 family)